MKQQVQKFGRFFERHDAAKHQCSDRMGFFTAIFLQGG